MSNFTIIKQKLVVIFIIIVYIISSLVFLNSVYNALFVWYDNDNGENVNDKNVPVSTMFGYKILLNSYVVKGDCTNYNKDIVLTTNINTILFKIYNLIFTFFVIIILISIIAEFAGSSKMSATIQDSFYVENQNIIYTGIASALILFIISNNFTNPGRKFYGKYEDDQSTFENYLYGEYNQITDDNYKNYLKSIIKNTNKNNFYEMDINDLFDSNKYQFKTDLITTEQNKIDISICFNILDLCRKLCIINKDTSVDVVKVFSDFIDNCEKSKSSNKNSQNIYLEVVNEDSYKNSNEENRVEITYEKEYLTNIGKETFGYLSRRELLEIDTKIDFSIRNEYYIKYINSNKTEYLFKVTNKPKSEGRSLTEKYFKKYILDNLDAYGADLKCIFGELDFLKNNFKSILALLWWGDGVNKNIDDKNSEVELEPIFFSSLLTKKYLNGCNYISSEEDDESGKYFEKLKNYTINQGGYNNSKKSFIEMINDAKKSTYMDLFLIKGILTGVIIFTLANIVLKKYYNEYPNGQKTLLEIDKKIILSKIDDNIYDAVKYENFIKPLLKEGNYYVNIVLSIIIILLLLKVIPDYTYPVKAIRFDKINCD